MKYIQYPLILSVLILALFTSSCIKEDEYKKFLEGGEIRYAGRADSVFALAGNQRIQLNVILGNDPNVDKVKAFWGSNRDSVEVAVPEGSSGDTIQMLIEDLLEGTHNFTVYTYDKDNNESIAVHLTGDAYGDSYIRSLANRRLDEIQYVGDDAKLQLSWENSYTNELYTELYYEDENGANQTATIYPTEDLIELDDYKAQGEIQYRSFFKPDSTAFDLFFTDMSSVEIPKFERLLAKELYKDFWLPTDIREGGYGWLIEYLWNGTADAPGFATESVIPQWFTIDLGVSKKLSKFKIWQANDRLYEKESVKRFEIWGSDDPNPDGSWDSWTKLLTCESFKPSGLPVGENSAEDIEYAQAGEEFILPEDIPSTRYIRFKLIENWGNSSFMTIGELSFWTSER